MNKTIESLKSKIQESMQKLDSRSTEHSAVLADYKGQTEGMIANLKKQLKEKEEMIRQKEQQTNEALLELQKTQKSTECSEASLRNEMNILKQKQEQHKKETNEISEAFQKARSG